MDIYTLTFYGRSSETDKSRDLEIEKLCETLSDLTVTNVRRVGEMTYWAHGVARNSVRNRPPVQSSVGFEFSGKILTNLLEYLLSKKVSAPNYGVNSIEVHGLLERWDQINGELSARELQQLSMLGADFTWSVIFND